MGHACSGLFCLVLSTQRCLAMAEGPSALFSVPRGRSARGVVRACDGVCVCVCVCVCSLCVNTRPGLGRQLLGAPAAELFPAESITCVNSTAANREHWLLPGRLIGGRIGDTEGGSSLGLYKGVSCAAGWLVPQLGSRRASPQHPLPPLLPLLFLEGE